ncbi:APC family permease [Mycolicibacterium sp. CBMA 295]|uniref:APC family permease n=1 Tax=Mycolicibacterium sp. CBMA 295 TaxID=2606605 RepID=UPI0012DCF718|nr:APC family permease [Mycolicibacterium sp. CBMA 295]MUM26408.1 amino acid permease [Mycolicibacterium sp. CBMA 295]
MSERVTPATAELQSDTGAHDGDAKHFTRSMGVVETLSLGFTYLSPLTGVAALLPLGLATAGPPSVWWLVIVAAGQLLVALVFGEVVSQYPITGGIYPWARRLWGRRYAWIVAWVYLCAMIVTITSVAQFAVPYVGSLFGFTPTPGQGLFIAVGLLLLALVLKMAGTKTLGAVARVGFYAEIAGVICYGLYLLLFERHNSFGVFFDAMGTDAGAPYYQVFLLAALTGLFMFYGFEACGDVAEEVENPGRVIPRAMILTVVFGLISGCAAFVGFVMAAPNLQAIVDGEVADPMSTILQDVMGPVGTKIFLVVAVTAFISCVLSLEAALSRLIFSFARDNMLPASKPLSTLSSNGTPRTAMLVSCAAPMVVCVWVFIEPDSLPRVTAFAVCGIYLCFQLVVLAALRMRTKGWRPAGLWSLGRAGHIINVAALMYGVAAILILLRPGDPSLMFIDRWVVAIGLAVVLGSGALYMAIARPWGNSTAPAGDALEVAAQLRATRAQQNTVSARD